MSHDTARLYPLLQSHKNLDPNITFSKTHIFATNKKNRDKMEKQVPTSLKFAFGGLSGCGAAACVQPMDLVKNRMQVSGEGGGVKLYRLVLTPNFEILRNFKQLTRLCKTDSSIRRCKWSLHWTICFISSSIELYNSSLGRL